MSDEQLKEETSGGAGEPGAEAGGADVLDDEEDVEGSMFSALAAERSAGKRFDAMEGETGGSGQSADGSGASGDGAGKGEDAGAGEGGEGGAAGAGAAAGEGAGEGGAAAGEGGAAAGEGGAAAGGAALDLEDFGTSLASLRDRLISDLSDFEVAPGEEGEEGAEAVKFADFAREYPAVTNAMVAIASRLTEPLRREYEAQQYQTSRERLLGDLSAEIPGARDIADSPEFSKWYGKQTAAVRALGASPEQADAAKLLTLYLTENPKAARGGGAGDAAGTARRAKRLGVLAMGAAGGGGSAAGRRGGNPIERAGVAEFAAEEDVEAEFERLIAERRTKTAK